MTKPTEREPDLAATEGTAVPERGWVSGDVSEELAGVGLHYLFVERGSGRSPRHVKDRLKTLAGRFSGAQAVNLRHQAIPWAYRVFFRHIGLDPDEQRTPVEEVALERMRKGGFPSVSLLDDALTIAIAESGVALRAFDADRVEGRLGIRLSEPGEPLEGRPGELPSGTLVIADEVRPLALLFGTTGAERGVSSKTKRTLLCAIQVRGVPDIAVEEALWLAAGVIRS
ncbi:MAG: B3/4 domain-containing protein [Actinomycetota bacterium]|nr:B3/4 domain-containing protein [Actinomycetota bacterium]